MKLMLAAETSDKNAIRFTSYIQPIINGVRCCVIDGQLLSRSMKPFANNHVQELFSNSLLNDIDGLLVLDYEKPSAKVHENTREALGIADGEPNIKFVAIDSFVKRRRTYRYNDRFGYIGNVVRGTSYALNNRVVAMPTRRIASIEPMEMYMDEWDQHGWPFGCMTRLIHTTYKQGRTSVLDGRMLIYRPEQKTVQVP